MRLVLALAALVLLAGVAPGWAQDAGARYATAYRLVGFRLRALAACPGNKRTMLQRSLTSISSPEFKAFSQAFPKTIEKWMGEGAGMFNDGVMQDGIDEVCRRAR